MRVVFERYDERRYASGLSGTAGVTWGPTCRCGSGRAGREQASLSERLAALVAPDGSWAPGAPAAIGDARLEARLRRRLAEVLALWASTPAGQQLVLDWPDRLISRPGTT